MVGRIRLSRLRLRDPGFGDLVAASSAV